MYTNTHQEIRDTGTRRKDQQKTFYFTDDCCTGIKTSRVNAAVVTRCYKLVPLSKAEKQHWHRTSERRRTAPLGVPRPLPPRSFPPPPTPLAPHALPRREAAAFRAVHARAVRCRAGTYRRAGRAAALPLPRLKEVGSATWLHPSRAGPCRVGPHTPFLRGGPQPIALREPPSSAVSPCPCLRCPVVAAGKLPPFPSRTAGRRSDPPAAITSGKASNLPPLPIRWNRPAVQRWQMIGNPRHQSARSFFSLGDATPALRRVGGCRRGGRECLQTRLGSRAMAGWGTRRRSRRLAQPLGQSERAPLGGRAGGGARNDLCPTAAGALERSRQWGLGGQEWGAERSGHGARLALHPVRFSLSRAGSARLPAAGRLEQGGGEPQGHGPALRAEGGQPTCVPPRILLTACCRVYLFLFLRAPPPSPFPTSRRRENSPLPSLPRRAPMAPAPRSVPGK